MSCFGTACQQPATAPPTPPTQPKKDQPIELFALLDRYLPQFNGQLSATQNGKPTFTRKEALERLSGLQFAPNWQPSSVTSEEVFTAQTQTLRLGAASYQCLVTLRAGPSGGDLIGVKISLTSSDKPISTDLDDLTSLVTMHYGESTFTYTDEEAVEWQFPQGKLIMMIEHSGEGKTLPGQGSALVFRLEPLSEKEKAPEKDMNRKRD